MVGSEGREAGFAYFGSWAWYGVHFASYARSVGNEERWCEERRGEEREGKGDAGECGCLVLYCVEV